MRIKTEIRKVKGYNAYCRDCLADNIPIMGYQDTLKDAALPFGTLALYIEANYQAGGKFMLCTTHAECLADDIMKQLYKHDLI